MDTAGFATQDDEGLFGFSTVHGRLSAMAWVKRMDTAQSERRQRIAMMLAIACALIIAVLSGVLQYSAQGIVLGISFVLVYFSWESAERYFAIRRELREAKALINAVIATSATTDPAAREVGNLTLIETGSSATDQEREAQF